MACWSCVCRAVLRNLYSQEMQSWHGQCLDNRNIHPLHLPQKTVSYLDHILVALQRSLASLLQDRINSTALLSRKKPLNGTERSLYFITLSAKLSEPLVSHEKCRTSQPFPCLLMLIWSLLGYCCCSPPCG